MQVNHEKVTIGLTLFNGSDFLQRLFKCIGDQDYPNLELVVVDDFSSDDTITQFLKVFEGLPFQYRFLVNDKNRGVGYCRKAICDASSGSYVVFFDQDDVSYPWRVTEQYAQYRKARQMTGPLNPIACFCAGQKQYATDFRPILPIAGGGRLIPAEVLVRSTVVRENRRQDQIVGSGTPAATSFFAIADLELVGGFDPNFRRVEDLELMVRFAKHDGFCIGCSRSCVQQIATKRADKTPAVNAIFEKKLLTKHRGYFEERGLYEYGLAWTQSNQI